MTPMITKREDIPPCPVCGAFREERDVKQAPYQVKLFGPHAGEWFHPPAQIGPWVREVECKAHGWQVVPPTRTERGDG
jgi:hypothetical protein